MDAGDGDARLEPLDAGHLRHQRASQRRGHRYHRAVDVLSAEKSVAAVSFFVAAEVTRRNLQRCCNSPPPHVGSYARKRISKPILAFSSSSIRRFEDENEDEDEDDKKNLSGHESAS